MVIVTGHCSMRRASSVMQAIETINDQLKNISQIEHTRYWTGPT